MERERTKSRLSPQGQQHLRNYTLFHQLWQGCTSLGQRVPGSKSDKRCAVVMFRAGQPTPKLPWARSQGQLTRPGETATWTSRQAEFVFYIIQNVWTDAGTSSPLAQPPGFTSCFLYILLFVPYNSFFTSILSSDLFLKNSRQGRSLEQRNRGSNRKNSRWQNIREGGNTWGEMLSLSF